MNKRELMKQFPFILKGELEYELNNKRWDYKTERGFINHLKKVNEDNESVFTMPDIRVLKIDIEWKHSRTWGNCPHAEWQCWFKDGTYLHGKTSASGWGYDKHSQVIANVFNVVAKGMAWRKRHSRKKAPYGIRHVGSGADLSYSPYFEGGIGVSCYPMIAKYLGGKMNSSGGRIWDAHAFEF